MQISSIQPNRVRASHIQQGFCPERFLQSIQLFRSSTRLGGVDQQLLNVSQGYLDMNYLTRFFRIKPLKDYAGFTKHHRVNHKDASNHRYL